MVRKFDKHDLSWIALGLSEQSLNHLEYIGDISDCGNEIGLIVGKLYPNMSEEEISDFIHGIKHGISLTNGRH